MHDPLQYCTFQLGESEFAIQGKSIQEVLRDCEWTPVPRAPSAVLGLMNLRGEIATVIDLAHWLKLAPSAGATAVPVPAARHFIVLAGSRPPLCLAVDGLGDVVTLEAEDLQAPPATLDEGARRALRGVQLSETRLISVLETSALLELNCAEVASGS